ncbi:MAG: flagellar biosynthesis anti-sigma factor FlgM [Candidatus Atribacteria bacterium]|nr:flagellar biosynthesis anti-sigma factor FlgM [Candidatus Atribacteria bacterium]
MKISGNQVESVIRAYTEKKMKNNQESDRNDNLIMDDVVLLCAAAIDVKKFHSKYQEIPDTRDKIISELKQKIQNHTYDVKGQMIVEKIIGREIADLLIDKDET